MNSVSNPKFRFIYRFSGENGKSLALIFQDSNSKLNEKWRYDHLHRSLILGHLDYVRNRMTTFVLLMLPHIAEGKNKIITSSEIRD